MIFGRTNKEKAPSKLAPSPGTNGSTRAPATATNSSTITRPKGMEHSRLAQTFAQIVAVLMRDPGYRNLRLSDLEWLVLPPVMAGQFRLAHVTTPVVAGSPGSGKSRQGATFIPAGVALWARVSSHVDEALSANLDKQVRLRPNEWASGDILWLMAAAGHPRAVPEFLTQLREREFKGKQVKMRVRGRDGKVVVKNVGQAV